jgi:glutamine amidotransferase PdxT
VCDHRSSLTSKKLQLKQNLTLISRQIKFLQDNFKLVANIGKDFPNHKDYYGTCRGLIILQDTYALDPDKLFRVTLEINGEQYSSNNALTIADIENMAFISKEMNWFDTSIGLIKAAQAKDRLNTLGLLKKEVVALRNSILKKKKITNRNRFQGISIPRK